MEKNGGAQLETDIGKLPYNTTGIAAVNTWGCAESEPSYRPQGTETANTGKPEAITK